MLELKLHASRNENIRFNYDIFSGLIKRSEELLLDCFSSATMRKVFDMCDSEVTDRIVIFLVDFYSEKNSDGLDKLMSLLDKRFVEGLKELENDDTNPIVSFYRVVNELPKV